MRLIADKMGADAPFAPEELDFEEVASDLVDYGAEALYGNQESSPIDLGSFFESAGVQTDVVM